MKLWIKAKLPRLAFTIFINFFNLKWRVKKKKVGGLEKLFEVSNDVDKSKAGNKL